MARRLGWGIYWLCVALAALQSVISVMGLLSLLGMSSPHEFARNHILGASVVAVVLYGLGIGFR